MDSISRYLARAEARKAWLESNFVLRRIAEIVATGVALNPAQSEAMEYFRAKRRAALAKLVEIARIELKDSAAWENRCWRRNHGLA
jgi:hypothetical protein